MAAVAPLRQRLASSFATSFTCARCSRIRMLSTSAPLASGHNKWSKIKHQKGAADDKKMKERTEVSEIITRLTKLHGADLNINTQLASVIAIAKKSGLPKAFIENALARGQGRSLSGAVLEPLMLEIVMPPSVALIVEAETDGKAREMQTFASIVKKHGGTLGSTQFLFTRSGRVVLERPRDDKAAERATDDAIMDAAIENGADDVVFCEEEGEDNEIIVSVQPGQTTELVDALRKKFGLQASSVDLVWAPNEFTRAAIGNAAQFDQLVALVEALREHPDVQAVYSNAEQGHLSLEEWARLEDLLNTA